MTSYIDGGKPSFLDSSAAKFKALLSVASRSFLATAFSSIFSWGFILSSLTLWSEFMFSESHAESKLPKRMGKCENI